MVGWDVSVMVHHYYYLRARKMIHQWVGALLAPRTLLCPPVALPAAPPPTPPPRLSPPRPGRLQPRRHSAGRERLSVAMARQWGSTTQTRAWASLTCGCTAAVYLYYYRIYDPRGGDFFHLLSPLLPSLLLSTALLSSPHLSYPSLTDRRGKGVKWGAQFNAYDERCTLPGRLVWHLASCTMAAPSAMDPELVRRLLCNPNCCNGRAADVLLGDETSREEGRGETREERRGGGRGGRAMGEQ